MLLMQANSFYRINENQELEGRWSKACYLHRVMFLLHIVSLHSSVEIGTSNKLLRVLL